LIIKEFPKYSVTREGFVLSKRCQLKGTPDKGGYLTVGLHKDGKQYTKKVHQLVAAAFLGPCPEGQEVRHKNSNPSDNRADNLTYGTRSDNERDKIANGTSNRGTGNGRAKLSPAEVLAIRNDDRGRNEIAAEYNVSISTIYRIQTRQNWNHI